MSLRMMPGGREDAHDYATQYRLILEALSDAVLFVHTDGTIIDANRAAVNLYGYTRSELLSMSIHDLRAPEALVSSAGEDAGAGGTTVESVHRRKDGSYIHVEVTCPAACVPGVPFRMCLVREITPQKQQRQNLALIRTLDEIVKQAELPGDSWKEICNRTAEGLALPFVWIGLKAPDGTVRVQATGGPCAPAPERLGIRCDPSFGEADPMAGSLSAAETRLVKLEPNHPWWPVLSGLGARTELVAPILHQHEALGAVVLYSLANRFPDESATLLANHLADLLGIVLAAEETRRRLALQETALNTVSNAVVFVDPKGAITGTNKAFTQLTGYAPDEVMGQNLRILNSGLTANTVFSNLWATISAGGTWSGDIINRRKDGTIYVDHQTVTPVVDNSGAITHFVAVKWDVTEKRQAEQLRYQAIHDSLTGLLNRRGFLEAVEPTASQEGTDRMNALMLVDLDNYKALHDQFGRASAEAALVDVARTIRRSVRRDDVAASLGGDQFAVLLWHVTQDQAVSIATRLGESIHTLTIQQRTKQASLLANMGIAMIRPGTRVGEMLTLASAALTAARTAGEHLSVVVQKSRAKKSG